MDTMIVISAVISIAAMMPNVMSTLTGLANPRLLSLLNTFSNRFTTGRSRYQIIPPIMTGFSTALDIAASFDQTGPVLLRSIAAIPVRRTVTAAYTHIFRYF